MAIVHSYLRFSTMKQSDGDSERRQRERADAWVEKHGHEFSELRAMLDDKGRSAHKGDKQKALAGFLKIMRAKDGRVKAGDILLVEAVDRLSRKGVRPTQTLINEILDHGIDIAILVPCEKVYRAKDKNDVGGAIELAAFAFCAAVYSQNLSDRVKSFYVAARKAAQDDGRIINSGPVASWLKRVGKGAGLKHVEIPEAVEAVKFIFRRTVEGIGSNVLTRELNEKFPPIANRRKTVKPWNDVFVGQIIRDRRAVGECQPHVMNDEGKRVPEGPPIPNYFPVIVDEQTWADANAARDNRRKERGPSSQWVNIFTGLVSYPDRSPAHCYTYFQTRASGHKVIFRRWKSDAAAQGVPGSLTETVDIVAFEDVVLRYLSELDLSVFGDGQSTAIELRSAEATLAKKIAKLDQLQTSAGDDDADLENLKPAMRRTSDDIKALKVKVDELRHKLTGSPADAVEYLAKIRSLDNTNENRQRLREAVKRIVDRIVICPAKVGTLRRSPIACHIEIHFASGRRRSILLYQTYSLAMDIDESTPALDERKDISSHRRKLVKLVGELMTPAVP